MSKKKGAYFYIAVLGRKVQVKLTICYASGLPLLHVNFYLNENAWRNCIKDYVNHNLLSISPKSSFKFYILFPEFSTSTELLVQKLDFFAI